MKKTAIAITIVLTIFLTTAVLAGDPPASRTINTPVVVENLLTGLNSGNTGLMTSSAYYLGELKSSDAVLPLMKMFHSCENTETRLAAALSLLKIGDERGIKTLQYAAKYDDNQRIKEMCKKFYNYYATEK
jgi:hypothetical protein